MKKRYTSILILLCTISLLSSCSAGSFKDRVKENLRGITEEFKTKDEDGKGTVAEKSVTDGISIGIQDPDTLNPLLTQNETVRDAMELIFEPLYELDEKRAVVGVLAEGSTRLNNGLTYEIKIKNDVKWHDEKDLTAYDVAYTINQILGGKTSYTAQLSDVASCTAIEDKVVRITLKRAVPNFTALLTFPVVKNHSDMTVNANYIPTGTGAYKFRGKTGTDKYILDAFGLYHNGVAAVPVIYIKIAPDKDKYRTMFETSETDIMTDCYIDLTEYMPKGKIAFHDYISDDLTFIGFNTSHPQISSAKTRAAISHMVDKDDIVSTVMYSRGIPCDTPINPQSPFCPQERASFPSNHDDAVAGLSNDGWEADQEGAYRKNVNNTAISLKLELLTDDDSAKKVRIAEKVKDQLERSGIKVTIEKEKYERYLARIRSGEFDMFIGEKTIPQNQDMSGFIGSGANYFMYASPDMDAAIAKTAAAADDDQLRSAYAELATKMKAEEVCIPLFFTKSSVFTGSRVNNGVHPSSVCPYRVSNIWSIGETK